jgi:hypothetical protein
MHPLKSVKSGANERRRPDRRRARSWPFSLLSRQTCSWTSHGHLCGKHDRNPQSEGSRARLRRPGGTCAATTHLGGPPNWPDQGCDEVTSDSLAARRTFRGTPLPHVRGSLVPNRMHKGDGAITGAQPALDVGLFDPADHHHSRLPDHLRQPARLNDVGFWVTVTSARCEIREPEEAFRRGSRGAKTRRLQEEEAGGEGQN